MRLQSVHRRTASFLVLTASSAPSGDPRALFHWDDMRSQPCLVERIPRPSQNRIANALLGRKLPSYGGDHIAKGGLNVPLLEPNRLNAVDVGERLDPPFQ